MKNIVNIAREHAFNAHNAVNHKYGDNLPYEYHLTYAVNIGWKFIHLIPKNDRDNVIGDVLEHDTIEDCNLTFNNLKDATNEMIAELA